MWIINFFLKYILFPLPTATLEVVYSPTASSVSINESSNGEDRKYWLHDLYDALKTKFYH